MNRPSWANNATYDNEVNTNRNVFECRPYRIRILGVIPKPEYDAFVICFDIIEGTLQGIFAKEFKEKNCKALTEWNSKGRYFVSCKESAQESFQRFITAVQKSNPGYKWEWDEMSLKGKELVMVYGEEEYRANDGSIKITICPRMPRSVIALNNNEIDYPLPLKKLRNQSTGNPNRNNYGNQNVMPNRYPSNTPNNYQPNYNQPQNENIVDDDDLPF